VPVARLPPEKALVDTDWYPSADNTYNLGTSSRRWKDGYFAGILRIASGLANGYLYFDCSNDAFIWHEETSEAWMFLECKAPSGYYATVGLFRTSQDGTPRFRVMKGDGTTNIGVEIRPREELIQFGADVTLYRSTTDVLKTDDSFDALALRIGGTEVIDSSRNLVGLNRVLQDLYLYKSKPMITLHDSAANVWGYLFQDGTEMRLRPPQDFHLELNSPFSFIVYDRGAGRDILKLTIDGQLQLPITGSSAGIVIGGDTKLYRSAANVLKTDDNFDALALRIGGTEVITSGRRLQNITNLLFSAGSQYQALWTYGSIIAQFNPDIHGYGDFLQFYPPDSAEYLSGGTWYSVDVPTQLFMGAKYGSWDIQYGWEAVRFTWTSFPYHFFEALYLYYTTRHHSMTVTVERSKDGTTWETVFTTGTLTGWPNHAVYVHFWHNRDYPYLRITFTPTWNTDYPTENITLYNIRYFGSYPAYHTRKLFNWDVDRNLTFYGSLKPNVDNSYDLGSSSLRWRNVYPTKIIGIADPFRITRDSTGGVTEPFIDIYSSGSAHGRAIFIGDPDYPITGGINFAGSLLPRADGNYDLGSSSYKWRDAYIGRNLCGGRLGILTRTLIERDPGETVDTYIDPKVGDVGDRAFIVAKIESNAPTVSIPLNNVSDFIENMGDNVRCVRLRVRITYSSIDNRTGIEVLGIDEDDNEHTLYSGGGTGDVYAYVLIRAFEV